MILDGKLAYGGDYNPEQWDAGIVDEDIRLMHEAGVNLVTPAVFAWAKLEPEPDVFELDWLEELLDKLHAAGIAVDLATATASPPAWMGKLWPSTLPVTADAVRQTWGSRQQYNPNSAIFRQRVIKLVTVMAERFSHHPAVVSWHIGNEYACHVRESFDQESVVAFQGWLQRKYGSIERLNEAWGTSFWAQRVSHWGDISAPSAMPTFVNPHLAADWSAFFSDALLECFMLEKEILRASNPELPITTNYMGLFGPLDYWKWSAELDYVSNDTYVDPADPRAAREYAFYCDLMRSLKHGQPFIQMEQAPAGVQWRERNAAKRPGQYGLWSLQAVARGCDGICNFQWRQSKAGAETFHSGMVPHAGRKSRVWSEVVELGRVLSLLGPVTGQRIDARVALVWDWTSMWAQQAGITPLLTEDPSLAIREWHATLFELGYVVDFVAPGDDLSGYQLVIVPSLFQVTKAGGENLQRAVEAGVNLLVTCQTGYVDDEGHAVLGGYLGPLKSALGVEVVDIAPIGVTGDVVVRPVDRIRPEVDRITGAIGAPASNQEVDIAWNDASAHVVRASSWTESVALLDAEPVAYFVDNDLDGEPAVTRKRWPLANAWYAATCLGSVGRLDLIQRVLGEAGIALPRQMPAGVELVVRGPFTFVMNHGDSAVEIDGLTGIDIVTGRHATEGKLEVAGRSTASLSQAEHRDN